MTVLGHSAASVKKSRLTPPEFWWSAVDGKRVNFKPTLSILIALGLALVSAVVGLSYLPWNASAGDADHEVAVLFPSSDVAAWPDFVRGVHLAAKAKNLSVIEDSSRHAVRVMTSPRPTRFQWYPVIGSFALQNKVRDLCQRPVPPLAVVGANNTALTKAIGTEVFSASRPDWVPLLLMTHATTDQLIDVNPGRSFRFGFSNSYQARTVVRELATMLPDDSNSSTPLQAIVVQVADNPFSVDLANHFAQELKESLGATILNDPNVSPDSSRTNWMLPTAGRGAEGATAEEVALARRIVQTLSQNPNAPSAIVLPTDLDTFRHLVLAIDQEKKRQTFAKPIYLLSGDSLDYYDVTEGLPTNMMPGPLLFFSHVNPVDRSISNAPLSHRPAVGLNRDLAHTLLSAMGRLGQQATPDQLSAALREAGPEEDRISFNAFERADGGAALVAYANPMGEGFEIRLPKAWASSP
ncbi:hypothetical protein K2X85_01580 [bacterium]|nr:hypothetical protein [bacterium]